MRHKTTHSFPQQEYDMRYVPRKRMTVEVEVELRKGVTRANIVEAVRLGMETMFPGARHQAQFVSEKVVDHRED